MLAIGLSHKTAPLAIREKLAFQGEHLDAALKDFKQRLCVKEAAIISTCNRTELYCKGPEMAGVARWWQDYLGLTHENIHPYLYSFKDQAAVQHMMRVASGLDSMVLGETQILGQLKCAYHLAEKLDMLGKSLSRLFQDAFQIAKKVRTYTDISKHTYSVSYLALKLAKQIYADISKTTILFIGAGENIELALKQFTRQPIQKIYIANRSLSRAKLLAEAFNNAEAILLSDMDACLEKVDIIIASTNSSGYILTQERLAPYWKKRKGKRLLMIDLAVPRDIDPGFSKHEEVFLYNLDDLQNMIQENQGLRQDAVVVAEAMVQVKSHEYMNWFYHQAETNNLNHYLTKIEEYKNHSLVLAHNRLRSGISPESVIERLANDLANKLTHIPILSIKESKLIKEVLEEI